MSEQQAKKKTLRIGSGAAWWGDRVEPAGLNAEKGDLDYLCFETMAEATVSAAQVRARRDPSFPGYDTYLDDRMRAVLAACMKRGTRIISNQGWINPQGAAQRIVELLREMGISGVKVAAVSGSLITERVLSLAPTIMENGEPTATLKDTLISAEAYMGAEPIVQALKDGAQIVVTGRVADPSLFVAPMMYEFGWDALDHEKVGAGSAIGHLMECGAQITGGYFSDPGFKDVPEPWNFAFPIAEVDADGSVVISKVAGSGGVYPIDVLPGIFQTLYKFMPFHYGMDMLRETIAGRYENVYWTNLAVMAGMCVLFAALGMLLYYPARPLNRLIARSKEKSGIM